MQKTVLITGATSGIGEAAAVKFAESSDRLIITGRRKERLDDLADHLRSTYGTEVLALCFDVRNRHEVEANLGTLPENWNKIDILVNNAGLAVGLSHIDEGDTDDWDRMIDTNVKGLLYVTRVISPLMVSRGAGHIFNIASIAGKEVYENGAVYCASKHAMHALSQAMQVDMLKNNIKVTGEFIEDYTTQLYAAHDEDTFTVGTYNAKYVNSKLEELKTQARTDVDAIINAIQAKKDYCI